MNKITSVIAACLAVSTLAAGCAVEAPSAEEVASGENAVCYDREGVNAVLAALAVAMGKELRRFAPMTDLQVNSDYTIGLSPAGKARCYDGVCKNTQAMLDMQKWEANGMVFPGGTRLDVGVLRTRFYAFYDEQKVCSQRPDNHRGDDCPVEAHDLKFVGTSMGSCGLDFKFHAYKAGTTTPLTYPWQLKNQLMFAGGAFNPFLAFNVVGDDITVDPTGGLVEGDSTASGSCAAVCAKYSTSNLLGACCSCNGVTRSMARAAFNANVYLCQ